MLNIRNFKIDLKTLIILIIITIFVLTTVIIYTIGFLTFIKKIFGIFLIGIGLIITIKFPQPGDYQPERFSRIFIIIGISILLFGVYLLAF